MDRLKQAGDKPVSDPQLPLFPSLTLVRSGPQTEDAAVRATLAEMHWEAAEALRADAQTLTTRFPSNDLADAEAAALRRDADDLLRAAHELAQRAGIELRERIAQAV